MAHFFSVYKALEGKETVAKDVNDRAAAVEVIRKAIRDAGYLPLRTKEKV